MPLKSRTTPTDGNPRICVAPPAVRARGVSRVINGRGALRSFDLSLARGTCCALMGPNGAGKTTLLRLLAMVDTPTSGRIELFGVPASARNPALRVKVGFVGHQPMVYRDLTCLENLVLFARLYRVAGAAGAAARGLERVGLSDRGRDRAGSLSRGMLQRLAIARALLHEPPILLADEPFAGLDAVSALGLERCLLDLRAAGRTVVLTDHEVPHALALSDRAVVLREGAKVLDAASVGLTVADVHRAFGGEA